MLPVVAKKLDEARQIADQKGGIRQLNLILVSERAISNLIQNLPDGKILGVPTSYHIWDISRLQRQRSSRSHKEPLDLDFVGMFAATSPACVAPCEGAVVRDPLRFSESALPALFLGLSGNAKGFALSFPKPK